MRIQIETWYQHEWHPGAQMCHRATEYATGRLLAGEANAPGEGWHADDRIIIQGTEWSELLLDLYEQLIPPGLTQPAYLDYTIRRYGQLRDLLAPVLR